MGLRFFTPLRFVQNDIVGSASPARSRPCRRSFWASRRGRTHPHPPVDTCLRRNDMCSLSAGGFSGSACIPLAPLRKRRGEIPRYARNDTGEREGGDARMLWDDRLVGEEFEVVELSDVHCGAVRPDACRAIKHGSIGRVWISHIIVL